MPADERTTRPDGPGAIAPGLSELLSGGLASLVGSSRQQLAETEVTGSAGGGAVTITMTGEGRMTNITISPELLTDGDAETLQDLVLAAAGDAFEQVQQTKSGALGNALASLGLGQ